MKKSVLFISLCIGTFLILLCTQCKKDTDCKMKITCYFSETGVDTGKVVPGATIKVGKDDYALYAQAEGYTDAQGVYEHSFQYEALLDVLATYVDSVHFDEPQYYAGSAQVKVIEGETSEKVILLIPYTR